MAQSARIRIDDKLPSYKVKIYFAIDRAFAELARDILINAKNLAPYKKGELRKNSGIENPIPLSRRIYFDIEYALFQEAGGDGRRRVRNYTTAGTGAGYLKRSVDKHEPRLKSVIKKHTARVK